MYKLNYNKTNEICTKFVVSKNRKQCQNFDIQDIDFNTDPFSVQALRPKKYRAELHVDKTVRKCRRGQDYSHFLANQLSPGGVQRHGCSMCSFFIGAKILFFNTKELLTASFSIYAFIKKHRKESQRWTVWKKVIFTAVFYRFYNLYESTIRVV